MLQRQPLRARESCKTAKTAAMEPSHQPHTDGRDVIASSILLANPALSCLLGQLLDSSVRLFWWEPSDEIDGLLRSDELPHAIRADEHEGPTGLHLVHADVGLTAHSHRSCHGVAYRARHGQARIHHVLDEDAVIHVAWLSSHHPTGSFDASLLRRDARLMIGREVHGHELSAPHLRAVAEDGAGVSAVGEAKFAGTLLKPPVKQYRRRCAAEPAIHLLLVLQLDAIALHLDEGVAQSTSRILL
mmetsp:Transcript_125747/g.367460  ORF Transcript_125747/g.367460 Transcript_125747/m.367460 type:complete len:244 (-) Transcript_125747:526-1257(-)